MNPKTFVSLKKKDVPNLGRKHAQVLCAVAEAVIDKDFAATIGGGPGNEEKGFRELVLDVDDFMNYQSRATVTQIRFGLVILEVKAKRRAILVKAGNDDFSRMSVAERGEVFQRLKEGTKDLQKTFYSGLVHLVASFYFGHEKVFSEIGYAGVSVDDQSVLDGHPWRPNDARPVHPCEVVDP